jgi:hypothetical protein
MRIFLSWSGERSKALASALRDWLPDILHYARPWLSESDIDAGERWGFKVAEELQATEFGIICVTRDNMNAPWLNFEAGALAKSIDGARVVPLLLDLGMQDITGPFAQFQAKKADLSGIKDILISLNRNTKEAVPESRIQKYLDSYWPEFEEKLKLIPKSEFINSKPRSENQVLEELVSIVRSMDYRLRSIEDSKISINSRHKDEEERSIAVPLKIVNAPLKFGTGKNFSGRQLSKEERDARLKALLDAQIKAEFDRENS